MLLLDDERRKEPHNITSRPYGEETSLTQTTDKFTVRHFHLETEHQPLAADILENLRIFVGQRRKLLARVICDPFDARQEIRREHDVENCIADRHGERIAAECAC